MSVVAVGRMISDAEIDEARERMGDYSLKGLTLTVIQGADIEGVENLKATFNTRVNAANDEVVRLGQQVTLLEDELKSYRSYEELSTSLTAEVKPLFPQVQGIDVAHVNNGTVAIVTLRKNARLGDADRQKMHQWLTARTADEKLDLIVR